ncbi:tumor necrosis factor ligand superfamily member 10-like isoform X3 [Haemorhous mexicanus]|uniref:tumor necrosis factor ligand superfamily member 10-like isoform X3 n=1 Tax=Haemorhous mexicanus TaxID=30427 RepID=UPI0028BD2EDD|nr:tumor necrosis factor ligand superfamily member 10-like isoform X3 [Haemorhous mexicanus]
MAPHPPGAGQYLRSDSGGSDTPMLAEGPAAGPAPGDCPGPGPDGGPGAARGQRRRRCGPLWGTVAVMAILALQIASTTGLFVYFTMAISKVTENIIRRSAMKEAWRSYFNTSEGQLPPKITGKPSAHLTLRPQSLAQDAGRSQRSGNLSQSCRHAITHWGHGSLLSHVQNMTYRAGRLRIEQPGKYYVYAQIYFRYRSAGRDSGPQLVQCIQWQPAYSPPVLLLKGVGTKCWAPEADFGLHALYQGGLFELKAGDELFVSVSSLAIDSSDTAASYFGAFRLDL